MQARGFTPSFTQVIHVKDLHVTSWPWPCSCSQLLLGVGTGLCTGVIPFTIYPPACMGAHTWLPDDPMLSKAGPSTCALGCPAPSFTRASPGIILALLPHYFSHLPLGRSHCCVNMPTQLLALERLTHLCSSSQNKFLKELSVLAAPFLSLQLPWSPLSLGFCPHRSSKTALKVTTSVADPLVMSCLDLPAAFSPGDHFLLLQIPCSFGFHDIMPWCPHTSLTVPPGAILLAFAFA